MDRASVDWAAVVRVSPIAAAIVSPRGEWWEVNPALTALVGYAREELLARSLGSITHPDDVDRDLPQLCAMLSGEIDQYQVETRYLHRDGRVVWVELHVAALRDAHGETTSLVAQFIDIDRRRTIEASLRDSRAKLRFGLESARLGFWEYDVIADRFSCDDDMLRMLRVPIGPEPPTWTLGGYLREFVCHDDMQVVASALFEAVAPGAVRHDGSCEHRVIRRDETIGFVAVRFTACELAGNTVLRLRGVIQDISERRRVEHQLRDAEQQLRQLTENLHEVVWMATVDADQVLYVSPAYERLTGRSCDSLYEAPRSWLDAVHPEDRDRVRRVARALRREGSYDVEFRLLPTAGEPRWVRARAFPLRDGAGRTYRLAGTIEDITERKLAGQRVTQAQKLGAVGQLASGIAHDFNNLLGAIMLQVDHAIGQSGLPSTAVVAIREIAAIAKRGACLARQLLRFGAGQRMRAQPIDLNHSVRDLVKLLERLLPETIRIDLQIAASAAWTRADPGMIDQILMNLAVNARDAMPDGGTLTIATELVELGAQRAGAVQLEPGRHVVLRCADTGCGIPSAHLARIFEPFFTTKSPDRGTGLGLAVVSDLVQQHRGAIRVTSTPGSGATFEIVLPALASGAEPQVDGAIAPRASGGGETILLVEDNTELRRAIRRLLGRHGYRVLEASNAADAIAAWDVATTKPDLLLTDLVMTGGVSGRDLAVELQSRSPQLKVILTSGYSADFAADAQPGPDQQFLAKPCEPSVLLDRVRWCLDRRG